MSANQISGHPKFSGESPPAETAPDREFDYSKRSQWLRAAVLGATDGLVSTASLMLGVGSVKHAMKVMILTGFAGLVAGACSMAIGEYVSVYSQLDVERSQMQRQKKRAKNENENNDDDNNNNNNNNNNDNNNNNMEESLPNPLQAAAASALAFSAGAVVPLLAAAFIREYRWRVGTVVAAVSFALAAFGWLGAALGRAPATRSVARVVIGGWLAMAVTFGLTKLIGSRGL